MKAKVPVYAHQDEQNATIERCFINMLYVEVGILVQSVDLRSPARQVFEVCSGISICTFP